MADVEKLKKDLEQDDAVAARWVKDPAEVMVAYGLADSKDEVTLSGSGQNVVTRKPGGPGDGTREMTICGCAFTVELEYSDDE